MAQYANNNLYGRQNKIGLKPQTTFSKPYAYAQNVLRNKFLQYTDFALNLTQHVL